MAIELLKNKTVLVTGGRTGFLGTNIAQALLAQGADIYVHSLDPNKQSNFVPGTPHLREFTADLSVSADIPADIDYVFHCAAHTSGAHEMVTNPVAQVIPNLFMNTLLLDAAVKNKVQKFVFISSSALYPESEVPISEGMAFEADPPGNYFGPGWMKRYAEKLAEFYFKWYGMEVLIIRPSNVYGPYSSFDLQRAHVIPALIRKFMEKHDPLEVWGSADVVRDFIYVDDFVKGLLLAFQHFKGFDVFNIASGNLYTIGETVNTIKKIVQYKGKITYNASRPMTIQQRKIDITKAKDELGFQATYPIGDGLGETIAWYESYLKQGKR